LKLYRRYSLRQHLFSKYLLLYARYRVREQLQLWWELVDMSPFPIRGYIGRILFETMKVQCLENPLFERHL